MTAQPALLHTQSFNPFDVQQDHAYAIWRDWKLEHAPSRLEQLLVEVSNPMQLTPAMQDFILHWGEMGAKWGVNRSVAQIHALLHLATEPMTADEICDAVLAAVGAA